MPEVRSPLFSLVKPKQYGGIPTSGAPLILSERSSEGLVQIAGWRDFAKAAAPALSILGFNGLGDYRTIQTSGATESMRIAPNKLLLLDTNIVALTNAFKSLDPTRTVTLDLSHARWIFGLTGPATEDLLARLAPLDFSSSAMPAGSFAQTGIHKIGVIIRRISMHSFEIMVPFTWAATIWELICTTAAPFSYEIEERR